MADLLTVGGGSAGPSEYDLYVVWATESGQPILAFEDYQASKKGEPGIVWTHGHLTYDPTYLYLETYGCSYNGAVYVALRNASGITPGTDATVWLLVLAPDAPAAELSDRLSALETVTIEGLMVDPSAAQELGASVTPELSWTLGGTATVEGLTVAGASVTVTDTGWTAAAPITATTVFTVEATYNGDKTDSDSVTVTFQNRVFWGKSAAGTLDSAGIVALANSQVRGDKTLSGTTSLTAEYLYVAAPVAYGTAATWVIGAFSEPAVVATVSVTTAAGHTEDYYLFRSENLLSGNVDWSVS